MSSVQITDTIFFTDDVDPPAIRAFNLGTRQISRVLSYTMETPAIREGISPQHADGYNRTLRPRSMVFVEDSQDRSALYWADAHTHVEKRQALYWPWLRWAAPGLRLAAPGQCLVKAPGTPLQPRLWSHAGGCGRHLGRAARRHSDGHRRLRLGLA